MSTELHVVFRVGEAHFAVPTRDVVWLEAYTEPTPVPGTPAWVSGLVQVRGEVVPMVDLRRRFGLPDEPPGPDTRLVLVRDGKRRVALRADAAREVRQVADDARQEPPEELRQAADRFVRALARDGRRLLQILDLARVIGPEEPDAHAPDASRRLPGAGTPRDPGDPHDRRAG